jgi:hypothetical protein
VRLLVVASQRNVAIGVSGCYGVKDSANGSQSHRLFRTGQLYDAIQKLDGELVNKSHYACDDCGGKEGVDYDNIQVAVLVTVSRSAWDIIGHDHLVSTKF